MSAPSNVSISNIINFTGVLGLLISLWFVNEEIKQSRLLAEAEFFQNRNMSLMAFYSASLEGSNLAAQLMKSGNLGMEIDWSDAEESAIYTSITGVRILSLLNTYNGYNFGLGNAQQMEYTYRVATQIFDNCPLRELVIQRVPTDFLLEVQKRSTNDCSI